MITSFIIHYPDEEASPRADETVADEGALGRQSESRPAIASVNSSLIGNGRPGRVDRPPDGRGDGPPRAVQASPGRDRRGPSITAADPTLSAAAGLGCPGRQRE